jgi:hypothetical protein
VQNAWHNLSFQYSRERAPTQIHIKQGTWLSQKDWEQEWE